MQFGTVSNVTVGTNSGSMGSGNSVNISRGKSTDLLVVTQDSVLMCPVSLLIFTVNASAVYAAILSFSPSFFNSFFLLWNYSLTDHEPRS